MNLDNLNSVVSRICFFGGIAFLVLVLLEELVNLFGRSLLAQVYQQETLLNVGAVLFVVVIVLLLRQIREEMKSQRLARRLGRGGAVVNLMANDTGNSGPGPAQVDLPGSFPEWLSSPRDHSAARGHLPSRTLPYGRERYEARWPLVKCLEGMALSCGRHRVRWPCRWRYSSCRLPLVVEPVACSARARPARSCSPRAAFPLLASLTWWHKASCPSCPSRPCPIPPSIASATMIAGTPSARP